MRAYAGTVPTEHWRMGSTEIVFEMFGRDKKTILHLQHRKWREDAAMFPECPMRWAIFLPSFTPFVETGSGRPHPHDLPVNI
jgi:hypothetical protein